MLSTGLYDSIELASPRYFMLILTDKDGQRVMKSFQWNEVTEEGKQLEGAAKGSKEESKDGCRVIWHSRKPSIQSDGMGTGSLSAVMPLSVNNVILGYCEL
jgi:transcriptional antiterminator Rof (Rho-off)